MRLPALAASFTALSIFACSAAPSDDAASSDSAQTSIKALEVVKGREWARCSFQQSAGGYELACTATKRDAADPLATKVTVTAVSTTPFSQANRVLDTENGESVVVGTFARSSFPLVLMADAVFPNDTGDSLGLRHARDLQISQTIAAPEQLGAASPLVLKQPFDLWPTGLIAEQPNGGFAANARYEIATGALAPFASQPVLPVEVGFFSNEYTGKIRYWVAPASGGIVVSNGAPLGTIDRPGYFTVTQNGVLRAATPEEILRDFPSAGSSTPLPDAGPVADSGPAPVVDAGPPDPTPGCGGDDETYCMRAGERVCDPGHRYDSNTAKCRACGDDGETFCLSGGAPTCHPGHRYDSNTAKCLACGGVGQTFCLSGGAPACNPGNRYDSNSGKCVAQ